MVCPSFFKATSGCGTSTYQLIWVFSEVFECGNLGWTINESIRAVKWIVFRLGKILSRTELAWGFSSESGDARRMCGQRGGWVGFVYTTPMSGTGEDNQKGKEIETVHHGDATPNGLAMNLPILHDISCISYKDYKGSK